MYEKTANQEDKERLLDEMAVIELNMKKQEELSKQQCTEHGYTRDPSQKIMVMIGKTGHGKSTFCNRICGDTSKKGNEGPFIVSAKKNKAGTTDIVSSITTAPFINFGDDDGFDFIMNEGKIENTDNNNGTDKEIQVGTVRAMVMGNFNENEEDLNFDEDMDNVLIVDTPGWGDVEENNRELCFFILFLYFIQ